METSYSGPQGHSRDQESSRQGAGQQGFRQSGQNQQTPVGHTQQAPVGHTQSRNTGYGQEQGGFGAKSQNSSFNQSQDGFGQQKMSEFGARGSTSGAPPFNQDSARTQGGAGHDSQQSGGYQQQASRFSQPQAGGFNNQQSGFPNQKVRIDRLIWFKSFKTLFNFVCLSVFGCNFV